MDIFFFWEKRKSFFLDNEKKIENAINLRIFCKQKETRKRNVFSPVFKRLLRLQNPHRAPALPPPEKHFVLFCCMCASGENRRVYVKTKIPHVCQEYPYASVFRSKSIFKIEPCRSNFFLFLRIGFRNGKKGLIAARVSEKREVAI